MSEQEPPVPEAALTAEDQGTLEFLRSVLAEEGRESASELLREIVGDLDEPQPGGEAARVAFLLELDRVADGLGSLAESCRLRESVVVIRSRLLPNDAPALLEAKENLALARYQLGDVRGANELFEVVLEARARQLPPEDRDLQNAKYCVAATRSRLGDLAGALELEEDLLATLTRQYGPDHSATLNVKQNLALTRRSLGDLQGARELEEYVLEVRARQLPPDDKLVLVAKQNLAETCRELGDLARARELWDGVLEAWTALLPSEHADLLSAKQSYALMLVDLGEFARARELFESVLEVQVRLFPNDDRSLLETKERLAMSLWKLGDLAGAREHFEAVLEARARVLPSDHFSLIAAKLNLGRIRYELGDFAGAVELEEAVVEAWTRLLSPDAPDLLKARQNLALTRKKLGDLASALELEEAVLEARTRTLPNDHPELLAAKLNLAATHEQLGDHVGAKELGEAVLEARTRLLAPEHPDLLRVMGNLAVTRKRLGDFAGARELEEDVLEALTHLLPPDHPDLQVARENLAGTRYVLGDLAGSKELVASVLTSVRLRAVALHSEAARPAREGARVELRRLDQAFFLSSSFDTSPSLEPQLFATLEGLRLTSVASAETAHALAERPELAKDAGRVEAIRSELNDLVAAGPADAHTAQAWRAELLRLSEERDRAERDLRKGLAEIGAFAGEIDVETLGERLAKDEAAVTFLRYLKELGLDSPMGKAPPPVDSLLAFVVRSGGAVQRVELGAALELETLVQDWRAALGRPLEARGIGSTDSTTAADGLELLGERLRKRVLDPVLAACGGARTLHLVLDDVLFLVPLDALPLEGGSVGERIVLRNEVTLARLLRTPRATSADGGLLAVGGIDYDAQLEAGATVSLDAATPPLESGLRSGAHPVGFVILPGARAEVESISALFSTVFEREAAVLVQGAATKTAFRVAAPKARYLHLATHGWFASETFKSQLDSLEEPSSSEVFQRAEATLIGFAPETLCGLALAGANRGKDAVGRVPGILTAEELASFDLRNCELAVLSACETNVGIRRAGQGIQSLQTALHAAGARTAITSLWKVDDAATRRLFELFYTKLWKEKLGKADALWQAKMALRAEGHPPRDWAGWVLSGDPD